MDDGKGERLFLRGEGGVEGRKRREEGGPHGHTTLNPFAFIDLAKLQKVMFIMMYALPLPSLSRAVLLTSLSPPVFPDALSSLLPQRLEWCVGFRELQKRLKGTRRC